MKQNNTSKNVRRTKSPVIFSARFIWRHIYRSPLKSLLTVLTAMSMMIALGWMLLTIERSEAEIEHLITSIEIDMDIGLLQQWEHIPPGGLGARPYSAFISKWLVDHIFETGRIIGHTLQSGILIEQVSPPYRLFEHASLTLEEFIESGVPYMHFSAIADLPEFFDIYRVQNPVVEYAPFWDAGLFVAEWTTDMLHLDPIPVILSEFLMEILDARLGDVIKCNIARRGPDPVTLEFVIAGLHRDRAVIDGASISFPGIMPLSALEAIHELYFLGMHYSIASFTLDPQYNRDFPAFQEQVEEWMEDSRSGTIALRAIFWDEQLRLGIAPLEQTLQLLSLLFPIAVVVSVLLAAGLSVLLLLMSIREVAYLRVLGATKLRIWVMSFSQYALLCILGLAAGFAVTAALHGSAAFVFESLLPLCGALYFGGMAAGTIVAAIIATLKKPIELLQVKE